MYFCYKNQHESCNRLQEYEFDEEEFQKSILEQQEQDMMTLQMLSQIQEAEEEELMANAEVVKCMTYCGKRRKYLGSEGTSLCYKSCMIKSEEEAEEEELMASAETVKCLTYCGKRRKYLGSEGTSLCYKSCMIKSEEEAEEEELMANAEVVKCLTYCGKRRKYLGPLGTTLC